MCQHKAPHRNWEPAPRHLHLFDNVKIPEPPNLFDDYSNRASPARDQKLSIDRDMILITDLKVDPLPGDESQEAVNWRKHLARLTPEQRDAMRQRWQERRDSRDGPGRRLSPEERRQLRDQIYESNRARPPHSGRKNR